MSEKNKQILDEMREYGISMGWAKSKLEQKQELISDFEKELEDQKIENEKIEEQEEQRPEINNIPF